MVGDQERIVSSIQSVGEEETMEPTEKEGEKGEVIQEHVLTNRTLLIDYNLSLREFFR